MPSQTRGRRKGGTGAARRSAIARAAADVVFKELPFALPVSRGQILQWAGLGLTPGQVREAVDELARGGVLKVKRHHGRLTALPATAPSSTIAVAPVSPTDEEDEA